MNYTRALALCSVILCASMLSLVSCSDGSCKTDRDCEAGTFCKQKSCVFECSVDDDCSKGETCNRRGRCLPPSDNDEYQQQEDALKRKDATTRVEKQPEQPTTKPICQQDSDCPANHACSQTGKCLQKNRNCIQSDCVVNDTRCIGSLLQVCERDAKGCGRWGTTAPCNTGEKCSQGQCQKICKKREDCPLGKLCNNGDCEPCKNQCQQGQAKCKGDDVIACVENHGCFSWGSATSCRQKEVCSEGKCKPDCTDTGCDTNQQCNKTTRQCEKKPPCTSHSQCGTDQYCDKVKGTCHHSYVHSLASCNSGSCPTGYACLNIEAAGNKKLCFRVCATDSDCGANSCVGLANGTKVCMKQGKLGDFCDDSIVHTCKQDQYPRHYCSKTKNACTAIQVQTSPGSRCNRDGENTEPWSQCDVSRQLYCEQSTGTCKKGTIVGLYDICGGNKVCASGHSCTRVASAVKHGYCFKHCSGQNDSSCNGKCQLLRNKSYGCFPYGTASTDRFCDGAPSTKRELSKICAKDHTCITTKSGATKGVCARHYPSGCTGKCPTSHICITLGQGGACIKACSGSGDTCPASQAKCQLVNGHHICLVP